MAVAKKENMVEYRWKIKYPDDRPNVSGGWVVGKRAAMKNFFQSVCANSELASSLRMDLKENIFLDKRVLNDSRNKSLEIQIRTPLGSPMPFISGKSILILHFRKIY